MSDASAAIDTTLAALAHPVRRAIVERLAQGSLTVGEIARPYAMKKPTISRHLKVLEGAKLIERSLEGRHHRCRLKREGMDALKTWLARHERFWVDRLDGLERFIEDERRAAGATSTRGRRARGRGGRE